MKNTLEGINNRISEAEEWISELEDKMVEIISEEQNKIKRMIRSDDSLRDLWDNIKWTNIQIIGFPEEEGNLENSAEATGLEKVHFHSSPKERNAKEYSDYQTIVVISHISKVILKILQDRLQQYMKCEHPDFQAGFRKARETRDPSANIHWIIEKARESQKNM